jgi:hypothetical protein
MAEQLVSNKKDNLVSIPALCEYIINKMLTSEDPNIKNAAVPSVAMFLISSCCPQHESQMIAKPYSGRFKIKQTITAFIIKAVILDQFNYKNVPNPQSTLWGMQALGLMSRMVGQVTLTLSGSPGAFKKVGMTVLLIIVSMDYFVVN